VFRWHRMIVAAATITTPLMADGLEPVRLPDPTRPPLLHQAAMRRLSDDKPQQFALTAIKISADQRIALVNGRLVRAGDRVGESVVVEIIHGAVVLDYLGEQKRLNLLPYDVRNASENRSTEE
jgi:hypothetical protein